MSEQALNEKIAALEAKAMALKAEVATLKGKIKNRDAAKIAKVQAENAALAATLSQLERCFHGLLEEPASYSDPEQLDCLRRSAIDYFTQANVSQELWKNIAY